MSLESPLDETTELPLPVDRFLALLGDKNAPAALDLFAPDAEITSRSGRVFRGHGEVIEWLKQATPSYAYSVTRFGIERDNRLLTVLSRVSGDFPAGAENLAFRFSLNRDESEITSLSVALDA